MDNSLGNWVFLSHVWGESCPPYGEGKRIQLTRIRNMELGDSCNSYEFTASNHIGTHYDFPNHFDHFGKIVTDYQPNSFIHNDIGFINLNLNFGDTLDVEKIKGNINFISNNITLLLIRTGISRFRNNDIRYSTIGVPVSEGVAAFLRTRFPFLTTIALDFISISSFSNRQLGRKVHQEFLKNDNPILIIEDANFEPLCQKTPSIVVSLPLRIENGDGAPVTIIAKV
ncbi:hypothetical protein GCL60_13335 [Silvanigrella paludirubra]|uniref:Cyclase family protein n=1 Tax=Silvanigrella paludirubra TaxID=2499159 RepID=A0A6N6VQ93_9BACT|nr:cyclase family protein [Silvanigrella paludirubra]KAB8036822.1 hypothetical protein GCL60_13335 [Silvanigrella paludirubra]